MIRNDSNDAPRWSHLGGAAAAALATAIALAISAPLSRADSGNAHHPVLLGQGRYDVVKWQIGLGRGPGKGGGQRPCVMSDILNYDSEYGPPGQVAESSAQTCSVVSPKGAPLTVSSEAGNKGKKLTVFGIVFDPKVRIVRIDFNTGARLNVRPKLLRERQARVATVRRVRYLTLARPGIVCIQHIVVLGHGGTALFEETAPESECASE